VTDPKQFLDLVTESGKQQLELNRQMLVNHLDASDRIHMRQASEALSQAAMQILSDPTK
jgi:hypothetical protein